MASGLCRTAAAGGCLTRRLDYAIYRLIPAWRHSLPSITTVSSGSTYSFARPAIHRLHRITHAHYRGVEGELPFVYWDKDDVLFVDLRSSDEAFATIDYSESTPLLYRRAVRRLRRPGAAQREARRRRGPGAKTTGFNCQNCGAAVELRARALTQSVACTSCGAILDPNDPTLAILQDNAKVSESCRRFRSGAAALHGRDRGHRLPAPSIEVDGDFYGWDEYLLFDP